MPRKGNTQVNIYMNFLFIHSANIYLSNMKDQYLLLGQKETPVVDIMEVTLVYTKALNKQTNKIPITLL